MEASLATGASTTSRLRSLLLNGDIAIYTASPVCSRPVHSGTLVLVLSTPSPKWKNAMPSLVRHTLFHCKLVLVQSSCFLSTLYGWKLPSHFPTYMSFNTLSLTMKFDSYNEALMLVPDDCLAMANRQVEA
jgi:hypothetical protein